MMKKSRAHFRKPLDGFGFIQVYGDDGGRILNISDAGLCFQTFAPIGNARNLQFWFSLNLRDRIEAMGHVAWLDAETKTGGLRFLNPTDRALKHIRAYSTGPQTEESSKKGRFFAAALNRHRTGHPATNLDSPRAEASPGVDSRVFVPQAYRLFDESPKVNLQSSAPVESTDLISLQRHLAVCRRYLITGVFLGIVFSSVVGAGVAFYLGRQTQGNGLKASVSSADQTTTKQEVVPAQSVPPMASVPSTVNAAASLKTSQSAANTPSYANKRPKDSQPQPATPLFSENSNRGLTPRATQPREGTSMGARTSNATPQQLWSAVQAGDTNAAVVLADRYLRGEGVPLNCLQARVLLLAASEKNNANATKKLHALDKDGCS